MKNIGNAVLHACYSSIAGDRSGNSLVSERQCAVARRRFMPEGGFRHKSHVFLCGKEWVSDGS